MIFVDSGAWYASAVPDDSDHSVAQNWFLANKEPLITTDYVVDEFLTLLKTRGEFQRSLEWGGPLLEEKVSQMEWVRPEDVYRAWITFSTHADKGWSFTDCVSRVVIERLQIKTAFAFDDHFRQFGELVVVPL